MMTGQLQQDGQTTMGQPMMSEGGKMIAGQQSSSVLTMTGVGQSMGQQGGGQMTMGGLSMMAMGGQCAPWQMKPAQMQMGQPLMHTEHLIPPQMYPPPGAMMYISGQGGVVVMVSSLKVGGVAQSDQQT